MMVADVHGNDNLVELEDAPRYSVQDVGDSPKLPEAAPRRSMWKATSRAGETLRD